MNTKILIPLLRKIIPSVVAQEIVGVQPMSLEPRKMSWEDDLRNLSLKYNGWLTINEKTGNGLDDANEIFQSKYPGPYRLIDYYDNNRGVFSLKLGFDNPNQELLWKIKWSS